MKDAPNTKVARNQTLLQLGKFQVSMRSVVLYRVSPCLTLPRLPASTSPRFPARNQRFRKGTPSHEYMAEDESGKQSGGALVPSQPRLRVFRQGRGVMQDSTWRTAARDKHGAAYLAHQLFSLAPEAILVGLHVHRHLFQLLGISCPNAEMASGQGRRLQLHNG
jgi:hypothetical protein